MDLVGQIEKLQGMALQHFSPLGQQQLNWKPAADRWSIAQCLHHLMVSNRYYFETFDKLLDGSHRIGFFQKLNPFKKMIGRYMVKALGPQPKKNTAHRPFSALRRARCPPTSSPAFLRYRKN